MRQASPRDLEQLVALMTEFYAESGYPLNADRSAAAFRELLGEEGLGRVWLIEAGGAIAGYLVVTLGYSMEYGGQRRRTAPLSERGLREHRSAVSHLAAGRSDPR